MPVLKFSTRTSLDFSKRRRISFRHGHRQASASIDPSTHRPIGLPPFSRPARPGPAASCSSASGTSCCDSGQRSRRPWAAPKANSTGRPNGQTVHGLRGRQEGWRKAAGVVAHAGPLHLGDLRAEVSQDLRAAGACEAKCQWDLPLHLEFQLPQVISRTLCSETVDSCQHAGHVQHAYSSQRPRSAEPPHPRLAFLSV